jgi:hypothetical protein
MLDVLFYLFEDVLQASQVFPRVFNAVRRFLTPLLVLRNAGSLLQENTHLFGLGLDEPRDHPLFDDRVAARAESRAQEDARDVLAATPCAIEVVGGDPIPADLAPDTDFRVFRVLALQRRLGVVEQQLDGGCTHRFAGTGAVKDHIRDGVATEPAGRALPHHPADGVDYVGFTAAVGAYHADEAAGKGDGRGVYK